MNYANDQWLSEVRGKMKVKKDVSGVYRVGKGLCVQWRIYALGSS